mmetsp:Transcript_34551/g.68002  ORF Transcript_34551/g.68002 Transcript_34551/m.68002 type:complete len:217 (+) Transcript_34551:1057-1707(+)
MERRSRTRTEARPAPKPPRTTWPPSTTQSGATRPGPRRPSRWGTGPPTGTDVRCCPSTSTTSIPTRRRRSSCHSTPPRAPSWRASRRAPPRPTSRPPRPPPRRRRRLRRQTPTSTKRRSTGTRPSRTITATNPGRRRARRCGRPASGTGRAPPKSGRRTSARDRTRQERLTAGAATRWRNSMPPTTTFAGSRPRTEPGRCPTSTRRWPDDATFPLK